MTNPFVGPRPLTKSNPIFGRNREITELRHRRISERLVLLHSPSGAGKSSLINAGLIPELEGHFDVWEPTRVNTEPPAEINSNRYVWSAIYNWKKDGDETTLAEFVHARPRRKNPLLIFDQFEEILRVNPTDTHNQHEFFQQLAALLADPRIWALIVIREDYLAPQPRTSRNALPIPRRNRLRQLGVPPRPGLHRMRIGEHRFLLLMPAPVHGQVPSLSHRRTVHLSGARNSVTLSVIRTPVPATSKGRTAGGTPGVPKEGRRRSSMEQGRKSHANHPAPNWCQ